MGGAIGDSTWMDAGEIPLISFHNPSDQFAPCGVDILNVPTANGPLPVMEVSGSCDMQTFADHYGLNDVFNTIPAGFDPYGPASASSHIGFFPFSNTPNNSASPWEWTKTPTTPPTPADCNGDGAKSRMYIDTIIGFYAPRACVALNLGCNFVGTKEISDFEVGLKVSPVPAVDMINFVSEKEQMRHIYVYDLNGRLVKAVTDINTNNYQLQRHSLPNGMYMAEVRYDAGFVKRRIVFTNN